MNYPRSGTFTFLMDLLSKRVHYITEHFVIYIQYERRHYFNFFSEEFKCPELLITCMSHYEILYDGY